MSEFAEFPKWLHCEGRKSVLVEDADHEIATLVEWGFDNPEQFATANLLLGVTPLSPVDKLAPPARYDWSSFQGASDGEIGGFKEVISPNGEWVKWEDVRDLFAPPSNVVNLLVGKQIEPKARGGWPKGKPRAKKAV